MSDTPKTDKAEKLALELTKELTWDCVVAGEAGIRQIARACRKFERENAALREDRDRLDAIQHGWSVSCEEGASGNPDRWFIWTRDWSQPIGEGWSLRAALDAARSKEAQP